MSAISGSKALIKLTSTAATESTGEAASLVSGTTATYQIDDTAKRHWSRDDAAFPRFEVDGSTVAGLTITDVNYVQGIVTLSSSPAAGTYTVDVNYRTASNLAQGRAWEVSIDAGIIDTSVFGSTWREAIPALRGASVTLGRFWWDPSIYDNMNIGEEVIVSLWTESTGTNRYEGLGYFSRDQIQTQVDAAIAEGVDIQIDGELYYTTTTV